ncbi:MAG: flavodoxin family protein, partial [Planctomycetaceae bacterium]|nr:flavodoxin family protein [Planctomycetaceae bacterium]
RSGGTAAFDQLNKYFQISELMTVGSCYWNVIHGFEPGEITQDLEGLQIVRTLGRNLVWLLKLAEHGQGHVTPPVPEEPVKTNFVR